jgi:hypothetical protein
MTRGSIFFAKRWIAGSSPAMTPSNQWAERGLVKCRNQQRGDCRSTIEKPRQHAEHDADDVAKGK